MSTAGIITHGIGGAPAGLAWFLLFGLEVPLLLQQTPACRVYVVPAESRVAIVEC